VSVLYYHFTSESAPNLHAFTADEAGGALPPEQGPWRLVAAVDPQQGWTTAAENSAVEAGVRANGFALVDAPEPLTFEGAPVRPGA